jgi:transposase
MNKSTRYSREVRERAVRLVFEHEREYGSQWSAIGSIAGKIGCTPETLRRWVRRTETDEGRREGLTTSDREDRVPRCGVRVVSPGSVGLVLS